MAAAAPSDGKEECLVIVILFTFSRCDSPGTELRRCVQQNIGGYPDAFQYASVYGSLPPVLHLCLDAKGPRPEAASASRLGRRV